jgi:hypothetical protein
MDNVQNYDIFIMHRRHKPIELKSSYKFLIVYQEHSYLKFVALTLATSVYTGSRRVKKRYGYAPNDAKD